MSNYSIDPAYVLAITGETVTQDLINAAESIVEEHAKRNWRQSVSVSDELYDGDGTQELRLRNNPIESVSAIAIYDDGTDEWDALDSDELADLKFDKRTGLIIYQDGYFDKGHENVRVSYIYSYTDGIPARAKVAIARVAAYLRANPLNATSEKIGDITISHGGLQGILKDVPVRLKI